ncbi:MAG: hypothetical protein MUP82_10310 [Candidatus Marinimicrobia bacterium]|nr:hypothetical protein [Candidatus Neomarinimicrobiota bacterium]
MKNLSKRHYKAIKNRGLINSTTIYHDFFQKITEEMTELSNAIYDNGGTDRVNQEAIDLMMVCVNLCRWMGMDIDKELEKNVLIQEGRV